LKLRASSVALLLVILAGCGGGSNSTEEVDSGVPPKPTNEKPRLERRVARANGADSVRCEPAESATELDLWDCQVRLNKYEPVRADIEVLVQGAEVKYSITECATKSTNKYASEPPDDICPLIH
jgi:hypothetical protein